MLKPRDFQEAAIARILNNVGQIVADECGLGKTLVAIEAAKRARAKRVLVIAPPSLLPQWKLAIKEQGITEVMFTDARPWKFAELEGWMLASIYEFRRNYFLQAVQDILWDFVIVDEAHRIKNHSTDVSRDVRSIPKVKGVCLTGTPMEAGEQDLWALLNFVDPDSFPAYWGFIMTHLIAEKNFWGGQEYKGPKDIEAFAKLIEPYFVRRMKTEVVPELPPQIEIPVAVDMLPEQQELYDQICTADDIIATYKLHDEQGELIIQNALALFTKLHQISSAPALLGIEVDSGKLVWLKEFFEDHPEDPTVVFSRYKGMLPRLCQLYDGVMVAGKQDSSSFFVHGKVNRLFGTIDKMGEGLNLQKAKHAIFLDSHWSSRAMLQAIDRVHRMDITEPKNIYYLISSKEDRLVAKAIERKWSQNELLYSYVKELQ